MRVLIAALAAVFMTAGAVQAADPPVLTVYTYNSFTSEWGPGPAVQKAFETECGCKLQYVAVEDGAALLSRLLLEGKNTKADVVLGLDTNLTAEAAATGLFCRTGCDPGVPLCRSIRLDVRFEDGVTWDAVVPLSTPTETWYTTTVFYEFTVEFEPDETFIAYAGSRSQFTVRNVGTDESPRWRLVEWRDLGNDAVVVQGPASTSARTWGSIKALYR